MRWPSISGRPCSIDLLQNKPSRLYNIPAQINSDLVFLRCGQELISDGKGGAKQRDYELYGVWVGYNENSSLPNRSVEQLAMLAGREYRLLYPREETGENDRTNYTFGITEKLPRVLLVEDMVLPAGTYWLEYEVVDRFQHVFLMDKVEFRWDGHTATLPEDSAWEGTVNPLLR